MKTRMNVNERISLPISPPLSKPCFSITQKYSNSGLYLKNYVTLISLMPNHSGLFRKVSRRKLRGWRDEMKLFDGWEVREGGSRPGGTDLWTLLCGRSTKELRVPTTSATCPSECFYYLPPSALASKPTCERSSPHCWALLRCMPDQVGPPKIVCTRTLLDEVYSCVAGVVLSIRGTTIAESRDGFLPKNIC